MLRKVITAAVSAFVFSLGLQAAINLNAYLRGFSSPDGAVYFIIYSVGFYLLAGIPISMLIDFLTGKIRSGSGEVFAKIVLYFLVGAAILYVFFKFHYAGFILGGCAALLFLGVETIIKKRRSISS